MVPSTRNIFALGLICVLAFSSCQRFKNAGVFSPGIETQLALLKISSNSIQSTDSHSFPFGTLHVGQSSNIVFVITNDGDKVATHLEGSVASPWYFVGGSFPGQGGTCESTLKGNEHCTVIVEFSPEIGGSFSSQMILGFNDGLSSQSVQVSVTGRASPLLASVSPVAGRISGGTEVTLTGSGFSSGGAVRIGNQDCLSVSVDSGTRVRCTTPAVSEALTVDVEYISDDNQTSLLVGGYRYQAGPTLSSVSPTSGLAGGGTPMTLVGKNFKPGASVSFGGSPCVITSLTSTTILCNSSTHAAGAVAVEVTNSDDGQKATLGAGFTYVVVSPPQVSQVVPNTGTKGGGTSITLRGSNFYPSATIFLDGTPCGSAVVRSSTEASCVTPAHAEGPVSVVFTNSDFQSGTLSGGFTYGTPPAPAVLSVVPAQGTTGGRTQIVINGLNFLPGAIAKLDNSICDDVVVESSIKLTCLTRNHAAGAVAARVTNTDGQFSELSNAFTYSDSDPPTVTQVIPAQGTTGGSTPITVNGSGFLNGANIQVGGQPCSHSILISSSQMSCLTSPHAAGIAEVKVTNTDLRSGAKADGFNYVSLPAPSVTSLSPVSGTIGGGTIVTITGTGFVFGATVKFGNDSASNVVVDSDTQISCKTPEHATGTVDVAVTNTDGNVGSLLGSYRFVTVPAPSISAVVPASGSTGGGNNITVSGTNFLSGIQIFVGGLPCTDTTRVSSTQLVCQVPRHEAAGSVDVRVLNTDGQSGTSPYTYILFPAPHLTSISPDHGTSNGGTAVTAVGTGFTSGVRITLDGEDASNVVLASDTSLTFATKSHIAGAVEVAVINSDGQQHALSNAFTFILPPNVGSVSPSSGSTSGGQSLTITGNDFKDGATVQLGSKSCTPVLFDSASQLRCTSPSQTDEGSYTITVVNPDGQSSSKTGLFTYVFPPPSLTSLSVSEGALVGGTSVDLNGGGFRSPVSVKFGNKSVSNVTFVDSTKVTIITPSQEVAGGVDVELTNGDGQKRSLTSAFTYKDAPTLDTVTPATGLANVNTLLTITGVGLNELSTVKVDGRPCTSVAVLETNTKISCVAPTGTASATAVDLVVTDSFNQSRTKPQAFRYTSPPPTLSGADILEGPLAGGSLVTLTGANFVTGASVKVGAIAAPDTTVVDSTHVRFHTPGVAQAVSATIELTNADAQVVTYPQPFIYKDAPIIDSVTPATGLSGGGSVLTIVGSGLRSTDTVKLIGAAEIGSGSNCGPVNLVVTNTTISCVTSSHAAGVVNVVVTDSYGQVRVKLSAFQYVNPAPTLSGADVLEGPLAGGTLVTLTGTGFLGSSVKVGGVSSSDPVVVDSTHVRFHTPPATAAASSSIELTNSDGQNVTYPQNFVYKDAPVVDSVAPATGTVLGGTVLTIVGTGLRSSDTVKLIGAAELGSGSSCGPVNLVATNTTISCVTSVHGAGQVNVVVTDSYGQSRVKQNAFTYTNPPPTLSGADVLEGPMAGGTLVTLTGTGFLSGASVKVGGISSTDPVVVDSTHVSFHTPAATTAGNATIQLTNGDGQIVEYPLPFVYKDAPVVDTVVPAIGLVGGGDALTINGSGLRSSDTVILKSTTDTVGVACGPVNVVVPSTKITCLTGAHAAGLVNVVVTDAFGQARTKLSAFTYLNAAPTLTGINIQAGPPAGGTDFTLTGTGFFGTVSVAFGGAGATTVVRVNGTTVTGKTPAGPDLTSPPIVLTNGDGQTASLSGQFTYRNPPHVTSVSPNHGSTGGGTSITITGTGFLASPTVQIDGKAVTGVVRVNDTTITAVTPRNTAIGAKGVFIQNSDNQSDTLSGGYTYEISSAPSIATVLPVAGNPAPVVPTILTITGTNFLSGVSVKVADVDCPIVTFSATILTCAAANHALSGTTPFPADVKITNLDDQNTIRTGAFIYRMAPDATGINPGSGPVAGNAVVTITGLRFYPNAQVKFKLGNSEALATSVVVVNENTITARTPASPTNGTGVMDVVVINEEGQSDSTSPSYFYAPPPTLTSISPTIGNSAGGSLVTITGTNILDTSTAEINGLPCTNPIPNPPLSMTCLTPAFSGGVNPASVAIKNPGPQTATNGAVLFTYKSNFTVDGIALSGGAIAGGTHVTISGSGFFPGVTVTFVNPGTGAQAVATNVQVVSANSITADTPPPPSGLVIPGATHVKVTFGLDLSGQLSNGYTYQRAPTVSGTNPTSGTSGGGTSVVISGADFLPSPAVSIGGVNCPVTSSSGTSITCETGAHAVGGAPVVVTNWDTQSSSNNVQYSYVNSPAPTIISRTPTAGPVAGGASMTIDGTGFLPKLTVDFGGAFVAPSDLSITSTQITAKIPAHASGTVTVTVKNTDNKTATTTYDYNLAPALSSLSVTSGDPAGGFSIDVLGSNFITKPTVKLNGSALAASFVTFVNSGKLTVSMPAHTEGAVAVTLVNPDGQTTSGALTFTYRFAPVISGVTPAGGAVEGGTEITLSGSKFSTGATVALVTSSGDKPCAVNGALSNDTQIVCTTSSLWYEELVGARVQNSDGQTKVLSATFKYQYAPSVGSVDPWALSTDGTIDGVAPMVVTINGNYFLTSPALPTVSYQNMNGSITTSACTVTSATSTQIQCNLAPHPPADYASVTVTNWDGQSVTRTYVGYFHERPGITSISPPSGTTLGGTPLTISGTNFPAVSVTIGGQICEITGSSYNQVQCTTPPGVKGAASLVLTNSQNLRTIGTFTYAPPPTLTSLTPAFGQSGTSITLTGAEFSSPTVLIGGSDSPAVNGTVCPIVGTPTSTQIICTVPSGAIGPADVIVKNGDNQVSSNHASAPKFIYDGQAWVTMSSSPLSGVSKIQSSVVWTGSQMIVWGGTMSVQVGAMYDPITDSWTSTPVTANTPTPRQDHTAVWTGREMIVWGGQAHEGSSYPAVNNGGRFDPVSQTWIKTTTTGAPSPKMMHVAVWTGKHMLVWGGSSGSAAPGGMYDPSKDANGNSVNAWTAMSTTNAPTGYSIGYWAGNIGVWTGKELVVWGGDGGSCFAGTDVGGRFDPYDGPNGTWRSTTMAGAPTKRQGHSMVWTGREVLVWGGISGYTGGGCPGATYFNDGRRYDPVNDIWSPMTVSGAPTVRAGVQAQWTGKQLVIWGGYNGTGGAATNTGGLYDPSLDNAAGTSTTAWTTMVNPAAEVVGRAAYASAWTGKEFLMWGGWNGGAVGTGARYTPPITNLSNTWVQISSTNGTGAPEARYGHAAVWTGSKMIIWGGNTDVSTYLGTGGIYDPATDSWSAVDISDINAPTARNGFSYAWTGRHMIIWGGSSTAGYLGDGAMFDPVGTGASTWIAIENTGAPSARFGHLSVWTGREFIVWGGSGNYEFDPVSNSSTQAKVSGARLDPYNGFSVGGVGTWTTMSTTNVPTSRYGGASVVWTGRDMIIWGGGFSNGSNTGGKYSPDTDTWVTTTTTGAPSARTNHVAVWTGRRMLIWGGGYKLTDGAMYDPYSGGYSGQGSWVAMSNTNVPVGRVLLYDSVNTIPSVWTGSKLFIYGATDGSLYQGQTKLFDPNVGANGTWYDGAFATAYRRGHSGVFTGRQVILWGGNCNGNLNTGYSYTP